MRVRARLLLDWFASVGITDLRVQVHDDYAALYTLRHCERRVTWSTCGPRWTGMQRLLMLGGYPDSIESSLRLTVAELAHFAEHGMQPAGGVA
ncbi:MAG: hypothetical protein ACRDSF_05735 [Pseudonocardiaceae bacterium]